MGNGENEAARCFSATEVNSNFMCMRASLSFLLKQYEPKSSDDKLSPSIGIVEYT